MAIEDISRLSIGQEFFSKRKITDFEEDHRADVWYRRRDFVVRLPALQFLLSSEDYMLWVCRLDTVTATIERRSAVVGGLQHAAATTNGELPTGYWWCNSAPIPMKQRCSERTQRRKGFVTL